MLEARRMSILFFPFLLVAIFIMVSAAAIPCYSAQSGDGGDLSGQVNGLLAQELRLPTDESNVRERYGQLTHIISQALKEGRPVQAVLSREEGKSIDSLLGSGSPDKATELVHRAILKLDQILSSAPVEQRRTPDRALHADAGPPPNPGMASALRTMSSVNIHDRVLGGGLRNILKLMNPVIDSARRRLYVCGTKSTYIGVVDIDRDTLVDTFDIGIPGGFLMLDPDNGDLYLFDISIDRYYKIDVAGKTATAVDGLPSHIPLPKKNTPKLYGGLSYVDTGYPFKAGYRQQDNASYGIIEVRDASGRVVSTIKHGPDALYFDIDKKTGKLYASNTGDGSISVFDLKQGNRKLKDIRVGVAIEEIVVDPDGGGFYVANRLGGSEVYHYDTRGGRLDVLFNENAAGESGIGLWPTEIIRDGSRLFVLSHFAGRIDVIDASSRKIISRIPLGLSLKPRTDALSCMVMDRKSKTLYAAFPELGEIAVADAREGRFAGLIRIEGFDATREGPGLIALGVDDVLKRLYVYIAGEKTLLVYDGANRLLIKRVPLDVARGERIVMPNPEKGVVYVGNKVLDARTLDVSAEFPNGSKVVGFDNPTDTVYLAGMTSAAGGRKSEVLYAYKSMRLERQWTLAPILSIPSSYSFDAQRRRMYVGYFESARVDVIDLTSGGAAGNDAGARRSNGNGPIGPKGGYCGDGICQPIEREKGVCPQDCK